MKREISRDRKLPVFKIGLADLELLIERLTPLFPNNKCRVSIDVEFQNNKISFDNIDELRDYPGLPDKLSNVRLWMSNDDSRFSLYPGGYFGSFASISAKSGDEVWCATILETALPTFQNNKLWYSHLIGWPIGAITALILNLPTLLGMFGVFSKVFKPTALVVWLILLIIFVVLYFFRSAFFPSAIIQIRPIESKVRRYSIELTLLFSLLALLVSILGLFIKR